MEQSWIESVPYFSSNFMNDNNCMQAFSDLQNVKLNLILLGDINYKSS